jgi:hypothetical protein
MKQHYAETLHVDDLAERANMSLSTFRSTSARSPA